MGFPSKPSILVDSPASLLGYAMELGFLDSKSAIREVGWKQQDLFMKQVSKLADIYEGDRAESHRESVSERSLAAQFGELDTGLDSGDDYSDFTGDSGVLTPGASIAGAKQSSTASKKSRASSGGCFKEACKMLGVSVPSGVTSVAELNSADLAELARVQDAYIGCVVYGNDDPRNHVIAVRKSGKSGALQFIPLDKALLSKTVSYTLTNPQEFFNQGGRNYRTKFYAGASSDSYGLGEDMSDVNPAALEGFGSSRVQRTAQAPPRSVVDESEHAGSNNTTGGVVRAKRRVVKGVSTFEDGYRPRRNYQVAGTTLFNNVDELYLNIISKDYVQEIMEELFVQWKLPTDQPETMRYAEDLLCAFLIARTASNKADYNTEFEVPTRRGEITVSFRVFSGLLADKYGVTRRNFARGMADELRAYLSRPENQLVKSRSAQRVGADPQYGDLCFDGSTGCTNVTSSEMTFCRLLEGRNLYERDDLIAEGASEKLMQGVHGSVRSVVQR